MTFDLHGVIPPVITPLTDDGRFDAGSAERLYGHMVQAGAHGLFLFGTSGEGPSLSHAARIEALDTARHTVGGRVPLLVGCIEASTDRVIESARWAVDHGADAIVACAPTYAPSTQDEIRTHFRALRRAVDVPVIAYDIPVTVKTRIDVATLLELSDECTIDGIKDSTGDHSRFRRLLRGRTNGFRVLNGDELLFDHVLNAGGDGIVPGLANVAIEPFVRLYEAFRAGDRDAVRYEQEVIGRLYEVFVDPSTNEPRIGYAIASMKGAAVRRRLIDCGRTCSPTRDATKGQLARIDRILREVGIGSEPAGITG